MIKFLRFGLTKANMAKPTVELLNKVLFLHGPNNIIVKREKDIFT